MVSKLHYWRSKYNALTYEHEHCIAAIEYVSVKMHVLLAKPNEQELCNQQWVANDIKGDEAQEWLR